MITADFINTAACVTIFLAAVRLIQTHFAQNSTLGSALAFIFH